MKILIMVIDDKYKGEYSMIRQALREANIDVDVASVVDVNVNASYVITNGLSIEKFRDFDGLAIIGGYRMYYAVTGKKPPRKTLQLPVSLSVIEDIVKDFNSRSSLIIAPLAVPALLARLKILEGKEATVYPTTDLIKILQDNGVIYRNELIVKSGNVITMKRPCVNDLTKILRGE